MHFLTYFTHKIKFSAKNKHLHLIKNAFKPTRKPPCGYLLF